MTIRALPFWFSRLTLLATIGLVAGCSSSGGSGTGPQAGSYTLTTTPPTVSVAAGASVTDLVEINRNAFTAAVTLDLSGQPAGVTATFSDNNTTAASVTMTINVDASVAPGRYTVAIDGVSTGLGNQTTSLTLIVTAGTGPANGFTLSAPATSASAGTTGTVVVTVTRTGTFTGPVTLSAAGFPNGVTASFAPTEVPAGQTTSTLSLVISGSAPTGVSTFTLSGQGTGAPNQTIHPQLTITAATVSGPFALNLSVSSYLALPPTALSWMPVMKIARNAGFTGPVSFTTTGLPATLIVLFTASPVIGDSVTLEVLNEGTPNGTYNATIHGTGGGGEQDTPLQIVVASPTAGSIHWTFCPNGSPIWYFAVKDGSGAWTRIVPNADASVFSFNVTQATASVAMVTTDSGVGRTTIYEYTAAEMAARAASECTLFPGVTNRSVGGNVIGLAGGELSTEGMGWWVGSTGGNAAYSLENLPAGPLDLIAAAASLDGLLNYDVSKMIIRRGVNPASGGTNPVLDFGAAEAFAPTVSSWTFGNTNGAAFGVTERYTTAAAIGSLSLIPGIENVATTRPLYGVPPAQSAAADLHQVIATIGSLVQGGPTRQIITYAHTLAPRNVSFGPTLPAPTVSAVNSPPAALLRIQGTLPAEYGAGVNLEVKSTGLNARFATVDATSGFLGSTSTYDIQMPNLLATLGWDSAWNIHPGDLTNWWVSGGGPILHFFDARFIYASLQVRWTGAATGVTPPADGATYLFGRASGSITP